MRVADYTGGPGFMAFVFTFLLVAVTVVLMRSLGKRLRKVRTAPPGEPSGPKDGERGSGIVGEESSDS